MWNYFKLWLQHKLDPHCKHCEDLAAEKSVCDSCEILKLENARLLDLIDKLTDKPIINEEVKEPIEYKPLVPNRIPWHVKQRELEANDRANFRAKQEAANVKSDITSIESLESEVLGNAISK